ncbi:hypothetical protein I4U23_016082 [Adineta vaga]|nr:hypothetical protein I4U23_016082 [Adineta vaga]
MFGGNPFGGGFGELASDFAINRFVPGGLNSPMGMIADNLMGGNPNGGFNMGMGGGFGGNQYGGGYGGGGYGGGYGGGGYGGGYNGGYGGGYGYY